MHHRLLFSEMLMLQLVNTPQRRYDLMQGTYSRKPPLVLGCLSKTVTPTILVTWHGIAIALTIPRSECVTVWSYGNSCRDKLYMMMVERCAYAARLLSVGHDWATYNVP